MGVHVFVDEGLGNSSYLLEIGDGRAIAIDPPRDVSRHLAAAASGRLDIAFSVETHLHADFLTGSRELAARHARVLAPAAGGIEWPHEGFGHGDEIEFGRFVLRALATPGHTPEHLAWLLSDGDRPTALFSGGALLVDAVARTDLIAPDQTIPLARALWHSLQTTVLTLPDEVAVYPTHGAGSFCSAPASGDRVTTIGRERRANPLLQSASEDAFVERLLAGYGTYPDYFLRLRARNQRGPTVLGTPFPGLPQLAPDDVQRLLAGGGLLVDARSVTSWAAAHVPGSVAIPLRPQFGTWLGWVVPDDRPLAFLLDANEDAGEVVRQARTIGYDNLAGAVAGGIDAWRAAGLPLTSAQLVEASQIDGPVLDVRQASEFAAGHLPSAHHVELGSLAAGASHPSRSWTVMCGHGERAATGASLLERAGYEIAVVKGGPDDWAAHGGRHLVGASRVR